MTTRGRNNATSSVSWGVVYAAFLIYRCAFSFIGEFVLMALTPIDDTLTYQAGTFSLGLAQTTAAAGDLFRNGFQFFGQEVAEGLTVWIAGTMAVFVGNTPILLDLGFQLIAFIGLVLILRSVDPKTRLLLLLLFVSPSFTVWTSIASKEAVVAGLLGIVLSHAIRALRGMRVYWIVTAPAIVLTYLYKPQLAVPIIFIFATIYCGRHVRQVTLVAVLGLALTLALLYIFRFEVDYASRLIDLWLSGELGGSSRGQQTLAEPWDTFTRMPYGMLVAFVGPTISEASGSFLHFVTLCESVTLIVIMALVAAWNVFKVPTYGIILSLGTVFWTLMVNFPFGLANPGTAIRYRADWIPFIFVGIVVFLARETYSARWLNRHVSTPPPSLVNVPSLRSA